MYRYAARQGIRCGTCLGASKIKQAHDKTLILFTCSDAKKHKPKEYPQQPETKTVAKHAMSEVCLLPRPSYSRGHMQGAFPQAFAILWPIFPKLVRRVFPKELLSASLFTSSTKHTSSTSLMSFISPTSSISSSTPSSLDLHLHLHYTIIIITYICLTYIIYTTYTFFHQLHLCDMCVKLRFCKVRHNRFTQNDCPTSKLRFSNTGCSPFARHDGRTSKTYVKLRV